MRAERGWVDETVPDPCRAVDPFFDEPGHAVGAILLVPLNMEPDRVGIHSGKTRGFLQS